MSGREFDSRRLHQKNSQSSPEWYLYCVIERRAAKARQNPKKVNKMKFEFPLKIEIDLLELTARRDVNCLYCYLILNEDVIEYHVKASYEEAKTVEDDMAYDFVSKKADYCWYRKRSALGNVDMLLDNREDLWYVGIEFVGLSEGAGWFFEKKEKAKEVLDTLVEYMKLK